MFFAVCKIDGGFDRFTKIGSALSIISPDRGGVVERRELDSELKKDGQNSKGPVRVRGNGESLSDCLSQGLIGAQYKLLRQAERP